MEMYDVIEVFQEYIDARGMKVSLREKRELSFLILAGRIFLHLCFPPIRFS